MDRDDFEALEGLLKEQFEAIGSPGLGAVEYYERRDEEGTSSLPDPREKVIEMLEAFDRHLVTQDHELFLRSIATINELLDGTAELEGARVIPVEPISELSEFDLSNAPRLGPVRGELRKLLGQLREEPYEPEPPVEQPE